MIIKYFKFLGSRISKFILIILLLLIIVNTIKKNIFINSQFEIEKFEDQKIIFFGNSQMKLGIDADFFETNTGYKSINFSDNGEPIYFTLKKIDLLISKNPNLLVVLNAGPLNFYKDHLYNLNDSKTFLEFFYKNQHVLNLKDFIFWFKIHPKEVVSGIILSILKNPLFFEKNEKYKENLDLASKRFTADKNKILKKSSLRNLNKEFEIKLLKKMLKKHSDKILLVDIPISKIAKDFYLKNEGNEFEEFLIYVQNNNINFKKIKLDVNNKNLFKDLTHLSDEGSILLTKIIIEHYNENKNN